jgi:hypothetical protein
MGYLKESKDSTLDGIDLCEELTNALPGVIQFESNAFSSGKTSPLLSAFSCASLFSLAVLNLLLLCWFILALGAHPSMAMKKTFLGLILVNKWSM